MAECISETGKPYGDPASYCFHHFCPYKCSWNIVYLRAIIPQV
jgi:hypothetical protein